MTWGVADLTVVFDGRKALDAVTLHARPTVVTSVVGGDGAGKTTLLRILAGMPIPHSGTVTVPEKRRIGYVPATGGVFADLTVAENLEFSGSVYGVADPAATAAPLLERTGLAPFTGRLAGDLSGGMRRKLSVISKMLHRPDLLILDEPTTGIDPVSRSDLWRLIAAAATGGAGVVVASAYLDESERASSVLVLNEGRTVVAGTPGEVKASMPGAVVDVESPADPTRAWRRGRLWREWLPDAPPSGVLPDLEDVVIVAALAETGGRP
ncbi:MAG: ABC transporter ATP-binding protein [Actinobacteria bacterium]|nr:ABC transporter ATP-binding protein [Actinomycetota bacterium]